MKHDLTFLLVLVLMCSSCGSARSITNDSTLPTASLAAASASVDLAGVVTKNGTQTNVFGADQDRACRQTIQNLYTVQAYCPDNLNALQSLYTQTFIQKYHPSLDRCRLVQKYEIAKLLFQNEPDFPQPIDTPEPGVYRYYTVIVLTDNPQGNLPGSTISSQTWIQVRIENNRCKIDDLNGGG